MARCGESGFSLIELVVAFTLAATLGAALTATFTTSSGLSHQSTTTLRVHEEHRRNLDAVADAMRPAAMATLAGFDVNNIATEPAFQNVTGRDEDGKLVLDEDGNLALDEVREITWRSNGETVPGVADPGELIVTQGGVPTVVARRVTAGSFRVTRLGSTLRIQLTTYCLGPKNTLALLAAPTSLTLRN